MTATVNYEYGCRKVMVAQEDFYLQGWFHIADCVRVGGARHNSIFGLAREGVELPKNWEFLCSPAT